METLHYIDQTVFHFVNTNCHNTFMDWLMPYWREASTWVPAYVLLVIFCIYRFQKMGAYLLLGLALTVGASDTISSKIIKPLVHRLRPCNDPSEKNDVKLLVNCGGGYSFTSSHACNHFAVATFLSMTLGMYFRRIRLPLFFWAASIAIGQVYVGVHYPFDILCGAILGGFIGYLGALLFKQRVKDWSISSH